MKWPGVGPIRFERRQTIEMKRLVVVLLVVGLVATVVLIRPWEVIGKPSEADCRTVMENRMLQHNMVQMFEIVSFKKADSYTMQIMGATVYVVSFELEVRYLKELSSTFRLATEESRMAVDGLILFPSGTEGSLRKISAEMEFVKTDTGWKGQDGKLY